jgi:uncharacterized protein YbjQ (UPF0145 family)
LEYSNKEFRMRNMVVTTGDLKEDYEIIGPVYFQVSNKGVFASTLRTLVEKYSAEIDQMKKGNLINEKKRDWGFLYGEWSVGQNDFEKAFFVAVQELMNRAKILGGNAIICMRQDIDLDTTVFQHFYLQMYGTVVKRKGVIEEEEEEKEIDLKYEICPHCDKKSEKKYSICEHCHKMKK